MRNIIRNFAKQISLKIISLITLIKKSGIKKNLTKIKLYMRNSISGNKKIVVGVTLVILFVITTATVVTRHNDKVSKIQKQREEQQLLSQTRNLHSELSNISMEIADVQRQLQSGDEKDIQSIEKTLMALSDQVKTIADSSNTIIEKAIEMNTHKLQKQLGNIQTQLTEIKDHKEKVSIVSPEELGFEVVDIFNMDHENIVSIHYGAHTVPIVEGENIAGWKLVHVSFNDQKAEFVNDKNQHVIVNLNTPKS